MSIGMSSAQYLVLMGIVILTVVLVSVAMFVICEAYANRRSDDRVATWEDSHGNLGLCQRITSDIGGFALLCERMALYVVEIDGQQVYVCKDHFLDRVEEIEQESTEDNA